MTDISSQPLETELLKYDIIIPAIKVCTYTSLDSTADLVYFIVYI